MPEKVLKKLNSRILPVWKVCFFAALLVGLMAHLYKITGWLPNWDSLVFRYHSQNMLGLGRWFLPVVCSLSSFYDLPFLNGIIAIVFHALGAVCICRILNIEKKLTAALIGGAVVSLPTVTSVMMYNYVADGYAIAFFMACLAAYLMTKEKPAIIPSVVLIALSVGIYQAYITVTVMLILLKLIDGIVFGKTDAPDTFKKIPLLLVTGILGVALYAIVLKVILGIFAVELLDYQGMGDTAALANINLPATLYVLKETFIKCFFDLSGGVNVYVALNSLIFVFTIGYYIKSMVTEGLYKKPATVIVALILAGLLFAGAGALAFVNPYVDYHNLMLMGYGVFYLFFLVIYERGREKKYSAAKCWVVLITALVLISNQVVIANVSYHKAQLAYEKSYGMLVRIADRIEQTPGSGECTKVLVIGALEHSESYSVNLTPHITGITDGYIIRADDETVGQSVLTSALNDYCGTDYGFVSGEEKKKLMELEQVSAMEKWPSHGCVAVLEDTLIIKLGTEGEN